MNTATEITTPTPTYRIERRSNCILVFGAIPARLFSTMLQEADEGALVSARVARIADASYAVGSRESLDALFLELQPEAHLRIERLYGRTPLSSDAKKWLAIGETGASSETIFYNLTGVAPSARFERLDQDYPRDVDDFRRCLLLLEMVPEFKKTFHKMAGVSPNWNSLESNWQKLIISLELETPGWRDGNNLKCPATNALIKKLTRWS